MTFDDFHDQSLDVSSQSVLLYHSSALGDEAANDIRVLCDRTGGLRDLLAARLSRLCDDCDSSAPEEDLHDLQFAFPMYGNRRSSQPRGVGLEQ